MDVKVMSCGGCTVKCMFTHLPKVFTLKPKHIILHIGTNDCATKTSDEVLGDINSIKSYIEKTLPKCNVIISTPIVRSDNLSANTILKNLNVKLRQLGYTLMDNSKIKASHLARKGLHLNDHGIRKIALNLIYLIKHL
jgi:hypothetical protein